MILNQAIKRLLSLILFITWLCHGNSQTMSITVGNDNKGQEGNPIINWHMNSYQGTETILLKKDLKSLRKGDKIVSLTYFCKSGRAGGGHFNVRLKNTTTEEFTSPHMLVGINDIVNGSVELKGYKGGDEVTFRLSTPFIYEGNNIIIDIRNSSIGSRHGWVYFKSSRSSKRQGLGWRGATSESATSFGYGDDVGVYDPGIGDIANVRITFIPASEFYDNTIVNSLEPIQSFVWIPFSTDLIQSVPIHDVKFDINSKTNQKENTNISLFNNTTNIIIDTKKWIIRYDNEELKANKLTEFDAEGFRVLKLNQIERVPFFIHNIEANAQTNSIRVLVPLYSDELNGKVDNIEELRRNDFAKLQSKANSLNPEILLRLARCCQYGVGTDKNELQAYRYYKQLEDNDYTQFETELDMLSGVLSNEELFELGNGYFKKNHFSRAIKYFRKAAERGHAESQDAICMMYFYDYDNGNDSKNRENIAKTKQLADQGIAWAQNIIGDLYRTGSGGYPKELSKSIEWYKRAALGGNTMGQVNLGLCYLAGEITTTNTSEAFKWINQAAMSNNPVALIELGNLYRDGINVTQDLDKAKEYYKAASNLNTIIAKNIIKKEESLVEQRAKEAQEAAKLKEGEKRNGDIWGLGRTIAHNFESKYGGKVGSVIYEEGKYFCVISGCNCGLYDLDLYKVIPTASDYAGVDGEDDGSTTEYYFYKGLLIYFNYNGVFEDGSRYIILIERGEVSGVRSVSHSSGKKSQKKSGRKKSSSSKKSHGSIY